MTHAVGPSSVDQQLIAQSMEELYEHGPCAFLCMLPAGEIVRVNQTFLNWTGYTLETLLGKRLQDLLTTPGKIYYDTHFAPLLSMQGFVNELAFDLIRADKSRLPILLNGSLKRNEAGEPRLIVIAIFDATDRRTYEQELLRARREAERASRIKADLMSMIGHDVRTPVTAIVMALELLERTEPTPRQAKALRILRSASNNLLALLDEVLDYSKIEAGKVTLEQRPFDIRQSLEELLLTLRPRAEAKGLSLELEVDAAVPERVVGDWRAIAQILGNLVTNAIKFTHEGGATVRLAALPDRDDCIGLRFSVSDTGIGIPQDRLEVIFDEFTQGSQETGKMYGGTGLGLAICNRLLALYDSKMKVTSREGEGSTFFFDLHLRAD